MNYGNRRADRNNKRAQAHIVTAHPVIPPRSSSANIRTKEVGAGARAEHLKTIPECSISKCSLPLWQEGSTLDAR